jgi:hypothetical protein
MINRQEKIVEKNLLGVDFFNYLRTVLNNNQTNGLKPWFFKNVSKIHQKTVMKTVEKSWLNNQSVCQKKSKRTTNENKKSVIYAWWPSN